MYDEYGFDWKPAPYRFSNDDDYFAVEYSNCGD